LSYTTAPLFWCYDCEKQVSIRYGKEGAVCKECRGKNVTLLKSEEDKKYNPSRR